jgi:DNA mismatch repair protein MutS2
MNRKAIQRLELDKVLALIEVNCAHEMGGEKIRNLHPGMSFKGVNQRLDESEAAMEWMIRKGNAPLRGYSDITGAVTHAEKGGMLHPGDLLAVARNLRVARDLKNYSDGMTGALAPYFESIGIYTRLASEIEAAIISEEEVADEASAALKQIRRTMRTKRDSIRHRLNSILTKKSNDKVFQEHLITLRNDRFVIPVKAEYRGKFPGIVHDQSSSGATIFVEPMEIVEINNEIRSLEGEERKEIERILRALSLKVQFIAELMRVNQVQFVLLDQIFAIASYGLDVNGTRPILGQDQEIRLKKARHPLLPKGEVVPVDVAFGKGESMILITGPNTGGKTVTLKTIGLMVMMSLCGIPIPVEEESRVPYLEEIYVDLGDEQSIEQSLSTFSSHMVNIVKIMDHLEEKSMVLLDELGAGTDPMEGAALARAILSVLLDRGVLCACTTHYSELKEYALATEGIVNASMEFDVETLSPTYRLIMGIPGKSNAFEIARKLGLQEGVIDRARGFMENPNVEFEQILADLEKERKTAERESARQRELRIALESRERELEKEKNRLSAIRDKEYKKARQEAKRIMQNAKRTSEELLEEAKAQRKRWQDSDHFAEQEIERKFDRELENLSDNRERVVLRQARNPVKDLKVDDTVRITSLGQTGVVLEINDKERYVLVQVGAMKMKLKKKNLEWVAPKKEVATSGGAQKRRAAKSVKTSLDLRGMTLEEALQAVDKYVDDALLSNLSVVTIIHGLGTGVLMRGVREWLQGHPHVKKSRRGEQGEGGNGVTVVEFR